MSIHRRDDPAIGDGLHRLTMGDSDGINLERNHAADGIWNALSHRPPTRDAQVSTLSL